MDIEKERAAFYEWASKYDHDSDEWQNMNLLDAWLARAQKPTEWQPIEMAPVNTAVIAIIDDHPGIHLIVLTDRLGVVDENGNETNIWVWCDPGEPPKCWTDGCCWAENEDGAASLRPTMWIPVPPGGNDHD